MVLKQCYYQTIHQDFGVSDQDLSQREGFDTVLRQHLHSHLHPFGINPGCGGISFFIVIYQFFLYSRSLSCFVFVVVTTVIVFACLLLVQREK